MVDNSNLGERLSPPEVAVDLISRLNGGVPKSEYYVLQALVLSMDRIHIEITGKDHIL
jgi:hypothetical protein